MSLPETMRAVQSRETGGAGGLYLSEVDVPEVGENQVLIHVEAAGINRPDILQRDGHYPAPKGHSLILGLEAAGEIVAVGDSVKGHKVGDKVTALVNGGGYGDYVVAHEGSALPVPKGLSMLEAAGLPETVFTVWHNVMERGGLKAGEWFMVHGGSSGIGTTAIQMAKAMGALVIATAGTDEKCTACAELGADAVINYKKEDFAEVAKAATNGRGVDVILDMVGGSYIERNFVAAAPDGRIVQIAFLGGAKVEVNFMRLMMKRLTLTGSTLRARDDETKAAIASAVHQNIWPLIEAGKVKPVIFRDFPLDQVQAAHELFDEGTHIGKIMLTMG